MGHFSSTLCTIGISAIALTCTAGARAEVLDDFSDGDDAGWTTFTFPDPPPSAGTWDASTGVYRLSAADPPPAFVASLLDMTADSSFSNGTWSATVVRETSNSRSSLIMRSSAPDAGYLFSWGPSLGLVITRANGDGTSTILANNLSFVQDLNEEYILEASAFGSELELRIWLLGDARPDLPQVTATDGTYASGNHGVATAAVSPTGEVSATFDDVSFALPVGIPTVSSWGLLTLALGVTAAGTVALRRKRQVA